jgi:hypothetical protein
MKIYVKFHEIHVKISWISWKIVTEINESLLETRYPQRELTRNDTLDQTFWVSKIPKRLVDRIFTEIFWFSQKIGKNSYKNAGIILGYPSIFRKQIFNFKNLFIIAFSFTRIYEKIN